jgi:hypothetical protein
MATYKILGQSAPGADSDTVLYTVPSGYGAISSTLTICNRSATNANFRVAAVPSGDSLDNKHYIAYDAVATGSDFIGLTLGLTMGEGDIIVIRSSSTNLSFSLFGTEIATA